MSKDGFHRPCSLYGIQQVFLVPPVRQPESVQKQQWSVDNMNAWTGGCQRCQAMLQTSKRDLGTGDMFHMHSLMLKGIMCLPRVYKDQTVKSKFALQSSGRPSGICATKLHFVVMNCRFIQHTTPASSMQVLEACCT